MCHVWKAKDENRSSVGRCYFMIYDDYDNDRVCTTLREAATVNFNFVLMLFLMRDIEIIDMQIIGILITHNWF